MYVWLDPNDWLAGGMDALCISATAVTLGMELTRCSSVLMNVDGRDSLPIVAGAETTGIVSADEIVELDT